MAQQYKERDFVVDLLSGKMVSKKDNTGRLFTEFMAVRPNVNPTIKLVADKNTSLNLDDIMIMERLRCRRSLVDANSFVKTAEEKEDLKYHKKMHKARLHSLGVDPKKQMNA